MRLQAYTVPMNWPVPVVLREAKLGATLLCAGLLLLLSLLTTERALVAPRDAIHLDSPAIATERAIPASQGLPSAAMVPTSANALADVGLRWDATWSTDVSAAALNVANLHHAEALIHRADAGDLDAAVDLVGAATWCLNAGPLAYVTDQIGDHARPCFERFGADLQSREQLQRASFSWVLRLVAAGLDDATLYASARTRGIGPDLLGGPNGDDEIRDSQRALLIGHLQTLAERGSADAASELHGHWSGASAFHLADERLASYYAQLTERLDPARNLVVISQ